MFRNSSILLRAAVMPVRDVGRAEKDRHSMALTYDAVIVCGLAQDTNLTEHAAKLAFHSWIQCTRAGISLHAQDRLTTSLESKFQTKLDLARSGGLIGTPHFTS
jgi:hypothetical protein